MNELTLDAAGNPDSPLTWISLPVPGGSMPIEMTSLPCDPTLGVVTLSRFPFGWERSQTGYCDIDEEQVYLVGEMTVMAHELTGQLATSFHSGDHVLRPRHQLRAAAQTVTGCLTLGWVARRAIYQPASEHGPEFATSSAQVPVFEVTRNALNDLEIKWAGGCLRVRAT